MSSWRAFKVKFGAYCVFGVEGSGVLVYSTRSWLSDRMVGAACQLSEYVCLRGICIA